MTYHAMTFICGKLNGDLRSTMRSGHWSQDAAWRYAARRGWSDVCMSWSTADLSGKGRGSDDGEWRFDDTGQARQTGGYRDVDDAQDVHDAWDSLG